MGVGEGVSRLQDANRAYVMDLDLLTSTNKQLVAERVAKELRKKERVAFHA